MIRVPPGAVILDAAEVDYLARALALLADLMAAHRDENGEPAPSRPSARLEDVTRKLARLADNGSAATSNGSEVLPVRASDDGAVDSDVYATVTPADAARTLGCSVRNVRDLAARGRLRARRSGGRWLLDAAAVAQRADRKAAHRTG